MGQRTPYYDTHVEAGARIVDFGGWDMPVHYGSQMEEHHAVRRDAGMFDVSHMTVVDLEGDRVRAFLSHLLANDVARLKIPGKALYSCMLNEQGGVIDDLITYYMSETFFRMVVNASTREKDLAWIRSQATAFDVTVTEQSETAMLAVQGPNAREKAASLLSPEGREIAMGLKPFSAAIIDNWFVARTGYTGEDGFEVVMPLEEAVPVWDRFVQAGIRPCGLGARDTLRLEAGMNLYGTDMDETTTPLESGLAWTVVMKDDGRDFIGRAALQAQLDAGVPRKLVGLVLVDRGVLRGHQRVVVEGVGEGEVTSGTFSPTLSASIAFARVPAATGDTCQVDIRGRLLNAKVVQPPFARNGKACIEI